ncbi:hypothetical protein TMatcc_000889 [Talaromyces marneffei ATCC 18224]
MLTISTGCWLFLTGCRRRPAVPIHRPRLGGAAWLCAQVSLAQFGFHGGDIAGSGLRRSRDLCRWVSFLVVGILLVIGRFFFIVVVFVKRVELRTKTSRWVGAPVALSEILPSLPFLLLSVYCITDIKYLAQVDSAGRSERRCISSSVCCLISSLDPWMIEELANGVTFVGINRKKMRDKVLSRL